jgi:signal transduction histidine kinase
MIIRPNNFPTPATANPWITYVLLNILTAILLIMVERVSMQVAIAQGNVSPVWPAAGIGIAVVWRFGYGLWPGILAASLTFTYGTGAPLLTTMGAALGNVFEAVLAVWLIRKYISTGYPLKTPRDVFKYFVLAALVATALCATFGVLGICFSGMEPWSQFNYLWSTWWLGDLMGAMIVAPALMTWARCLRKKIPAVEIARGVFIIAIIAVADFLILRTDTQLQGVRYSLAFLCIPLLLWAGFRLEQTGAVTASFITCVIAIYCTVQGRGPFVEESTNTSLLLLQCFMGVTAMTVLVLAAAVNVQRITEASLALQAQELARSNADLEQFAYVASHDLQEPLRMIGSYCQLLERRYTELLDADGKCYIHFAVDGARRMQELIDDLLQYSRVGRRHEPFKRVDCVLALRRATVNLKATIREKGAHITWDSLPTIVADPNQLTQLFQNLLSNGMKYCQEVPPKIHIWSEFRLNEWVFYIRDNGIGIPEEHRKRIFMIFQRLHTREEYSGTGIGLAICKRIADHHRGRIWVTSGPQGQGSVFCFSIPLIKASEPSNNWEPTRSQKRKVITRPTLQWT